MAKLQLRARPETLVTVRSRGVGRQLFRLVPLILKTRESRQSALVSLEGAPSGVSGRTVSSRHRRERSARQEGIGDLAGRPGGGEAHRRAVRDRAIHQRPQRRGAVTRAGFQTLPGGGRSRNISFTLARMASKLDRYRETARMMLEPWLVEAALARLGERRLTREEQETVVRATRTPHKVQWPDWWEARPS